MLIYQTIHFKYYAKIPDKEMLQLQKWNRSLFVVMYPGTLLLHKHSLDIFYMNIALEATVLCHSSPSVLLKIE